MATQARLAGRPVEGLLFDYGHTLITYERPQDALLDVYTGISRYLRAHGHEKPPSPEELLSKVHDRIEKVVANHEAEGGLEEIDLVSAERVAWSAAGVTLDDETLTRLTFMVQQAWWEGVMVPAGLFDIMEELRGRGLKVGICSNAPYRPDTMHAQLRHLGLDRIFDSVTFSSEVGWRKPSPKLFLAALEALGTRPEATVMIGDRCREDIRGALELNMGTIRTRQHRDDACQDVEADAVIDSLDELLRVLYWW
jgi:HAD superfamily hydrolase (TIGR01549 family)